MPPQSSNKVAPSVIELRGDNRSLFSSKEHEVMLSGPADTGKTVASCVKLHAICALVPGAQCAMVRKTYSSLVGSVVRTFMRLTAKSGITVFGGETPSRFIYPNGSIIWLGGLDNPDRVLSSERDAIYVNQAEEIDLNDWETLLTRCSGRAAVIKNPQLFGDCNPGGSKHFLRARAEEGKMRMLCAKHTDNPTIYRQLTEAQLLKEFPSGAPEGTLQRGGFHYVLTESGRMRLNVLQNLSGVRRKRLLEGIWATAEGAVYDMFDVQHHRLVRDWKQMKRFFLAIDEGYTNPAVILLIGEDADGRQHCFKEFYKRGVLQSLVVQTAKEWFNDPVGIITGHPSKLGERPKVEYAAVDESAAGLIADLQAAGVRAVGGKGRVLDGIATVQNRLKVQGDGLPRYTIDPGCTEHINEFESYVWKPEKDVPEKEFDHSLDAYRYLQDVQAVPSGGWRTEDVKHLPQPMPTLGDAELEQLDVEIVPDSEL